jgi:class 3 adenylate cyclase
VRFWDVSGPEVEAADAAPWDGPLASTMRPLSTRTFVRLAMVTSVLLALAGAALLVVPLTTARAAAHPTALIIISGYAIAAGIGLVVMILSWSPLDLRRWGPAVGFGNLIFSSALVSGAVFAAGPHLGVMAAGYVEAPLFAFYILRRRWGLTCVVLIIIGFGLVVLLQRGWASPGGQWLILLATVVATGFLMGVIAEQSDLLAESEHAARSELAVVNRGLEDRVQAQVAEIEGLGRLRRFLSAQVADAVVSDGAEALSRPHRQRIAVFFCDLRGFTSFTNQAEPEDVVGVLDEYYGAVGGLLQRYDATIGGYSGDGIMAYFGDPVPCAEPALIAVHMAAELRHSLDDLIQRWSRRGYPLGYGIGLSFGYATLGVIGFDGRYDYTPLGAVVNLAARLCGQAAAGQILLDQPTHAATSDRLPSSHFADLNLKGYTALVPTYALAASTAPPVGRPRPRPRDQR